MQSVRWILVAAVSLGVAAVGGGTPVRAAAPAQESGAPAVSTDAAVTRPRLEVDQVEIDGGEVEPGKMVDFVFPLRNTGQLPLEIQKVKPSCGCIIVGNFDHTIPPGGVGSVRAAIRTAGLRGQVTKHLTVMSNDPEHPAFTLTMSARMFQPIEVFPGLDILLPLNPGRPTSLEVVVRCNEKQPLEIKKIETSVDFVHARLLPSAIAAGDPSTDQRLEITVDKAPPTEVFDATITLHVNRPARPQILLHVSGYPRTAVAATPPRIYFGELDAQGASIQTRVITLFRRQGSFRVLDVKAGDPALTLQVEPSSDGSYTDVRVVYHGGWKPGPVAGKIIVRTDDPARPTIEIPYEGVVVG
jgi:hypothetical protein